MFASWKPLGQPMTLDEYQFNVILLSLQVLNAASSNPTAHWTRSVLPPRRIQYSASLSDRSLHDPKRGEKSLKWATKLPLLFSTEGGRVNDML